MKKNDVTRIMVEAAVAKALRDMRTDPKRSVRNLVDLGCSFSGGRFQKAFFKLASNLLKNENSAYYTLAEKLASDVHPELLQKFGVNLGYNSFTCGAQSIREREAVCGYNIPWSLTFHLDSSENPSFEKAGALIAEGKTLGIFTYAFFAAAPSIAPGSLIRLMRDHADCAFLLFLTSLPPDAAFLPALTACANAMLFLDAGQPGWEAAAKRLERQRLLYGAHRYYGEDTAQAILSGEWMDAAAACGCAAAVCIAQPGCPPDAASRVASAVAKARTEQHRPLFLIDYYADNLSIDTVISDESCFFGITPDGRITTSNGAGETVTGQTLGDGSLDRLLAGHRTNHCAARIEGGRPEI